MTRSRTRQLRPAHRGDFQPGADLFFRFNGSGQAEPARVVSMQGRVVLVDIESLGRMVVTVRELFAQNRES